MQPGYSVPYFEVDPVVYERMRESVFAQKKRMLIQPTHAGSSTNASLTRTSVAFHVDSFVPARNLFRANMNFESIEIAVSSVGHALDLALAKGAHTVHYKKGLHVSRSPPAAP